MKTLEEKCHLVYNEILQITDSILGTKATYSNDLDTVGKKLMGRKFIGVFPSDVIPKMKNDTYCILNLDKSDMPGSHWVACARDGKNVIVYDSFGRKSKKILSSVFKSGNGTVKDTDYDVEQKMKEENCGSRSMAFLLFHQMFGAKYSLLI